MPAYGIIGRAAAERRRRVFTLRSIAAAVVLATIIAVAILTRPQPKDGPVGATAFQPPFMTKFEESDYSDLHEPVLPMNREYEVVALEVPIVYNKYGDTDLDGLMFTLAENAPTLEEYARNFKFPVPPLPFKKILKNSFETNPLVRPLVLRCNHHDKVTVHFRNQIRNRKVGMHLASDGYNVESDGAAVGRNPPSIVGFGESIVYKWKCGHEGVFHIGDAGNLGGTEADTNLHGLFGALVVEPFGSRWTDPHTGKPIRDGLTADIHPPKKRYVRNPSLTHLTFQTYSTLFINSCSGFQNKLRPFLGFEPELHHPSESFREHVTIFHDEPEIHYATRQAESPCKKSVFEITRGIEATREEDQVHAINYRSEPLRNRESFVFTQIEAGNLKRPAYGEEIHHSSWMNGDPPENVVFFNYAGDPCKFRVVHGGVKETHVFHWHVHQWYAVEGKEDSPIIDSFSLSPQWATTFTALYGAGSRLKSIGDVIFHCHLYPHFSLGMWGIFRVFDTLQDGSLNYPNGKPIRPVLPLPGRESPPKPTKERPGFPNFINGEVGQKSPRIPWDVDKWGPIPEGADYRPATPLEVAGMNKAPEPGNMFTLNPTPKAGTIDPETGFTLRAIERNVTAVNRDMLFNQYGWHDPTGHLYQLDGEIRGERNVPTFYDPLILRANNGDRIQIRDRNGFDTAIPGSVFDPPFPDCPQHPTEGEVGMHVHLVKFDVLVADGASVGWNYMSGARFGKYLLPLWWADREFGHVFFHDHLFANFRQKRGLYGLAPIEPINSTYVCPFNQQEQIITGVQAVILPPNASEVTPRNNNINKIRMKDNGLYPSDADYAAPEDNFDSNPKNGFGESIIRNSLDLLPGAFREWVQFVGDFHPAFTENGVPLNPPNFPGSDQDNGVMVVNYRSEPLRERIKKFRRENGKEVDPAELFSSHVFGDPSTTIYPGYPGDQIRLRIAQGSHEESHSFNAYGFRWNDLFTDPNSRLVNQQILGISKAFTKIIEPVYSPGDHLVYWRAIDDTWLGCWGLGRVFDKIQDNVPTLPNNPNPFLDQPFANPNSTLYKPPRHKHREYKVIAESRNIDYTEGFLGEDRQDPLGLIYRVTAFKEPEQDWVELKHDPKNPKPLVIRAIEGEYVTIHLTNKINPNLRAEPQRPEVPVDLLNFRKVSSRVSIHSELLLYDVRVNDGTNVGLNPDQTVPNGETRSYTWFADKFYGGPIALQDQSDFRNHRHHGLIGALLIEPVGWQPTRWVGAESTLRKLWTFPSSSGKEITFKNTGGTLGLEAVEEEDFLVDEHVLILQDGLRQFRDGDLRQPVPDFVGDVPSDTDPVAEDLNINPNENANAQANQERPWLDPNMDKNEPFVDPDNDVENNHLRRRLHRRSRKRRDVDVDSLNWPSDPSRRPDPAKADPQKGSARNYTLAPFWPGMTNPKLKTWCDMYTISGFKDDKVYPWENDEDQICTQINPTDVDPEDQGQKALNYRSAPTFNPIWLQPDHPSTPIFHGTKGRLQLLHLVAPNDKPRGISIHVHGHTFREFENAGSIATAVDNAINPGRTEAVVFRAEHEGDWAIRGGGLRSFVSEGMWCLLRVEDKSGFGYQKDDCDD
ncbi:hypothetical protein HDV00_002220 [Rhizophlyctis rosea]|nr:hypothetical protein HDV00_002220 [Rhizophlyctis rosea]